MTTIAILPDNPGSSTTHFRAVAGKKQAGGKTAGEALDALTSQLDEEETGTLLIVQNLRPDRFFNEIEQKRLQELMARWRQARDSGQTMPSAEQAELEALVEKEIQAAGARAAALVHGLKP
jgi:hypothetical protein